jgi:hypothetical protein
MDVLGSQNDDEGRSRKYEVVTDCSDSWNMNMSKIKLRFIIEIPICGSNGGTSLITFNNVYKKNYHNV